MGWSVVSDEPVTAANERTQDVGNGGGPGATDVRRPGAVPAPPVGDGSAARRPPIPVVEPVNMGYGDCVDCGCDPIAHTSGDCPHNCDGANGYE